MKNHGKARVSPSNPRAFAICDRCGFLYNHSDLKWQMDYAGAGLINKRILSCNSCLDVPQKQLKAIVLPADPMPIQNSRVQDYDGASIDFRVTTVPAASDPVTGIPVQSGDFLQTMDGKFVVKSPVGNPTGLNANAVMPVQSGIQYGLPLSVISVFSTGTNIMTVTCSVAHGLSTNAQVSIQDLLNNDAAGFYSVTVISAMAFTYQTVKNIPASSLLKPSTLIATAIVGLPRGFTQIPEIGA